MVKENILYLSQIEDNVTKRKRMYYKDFITQKGSTSKLVKIKDIISGEDIVNYPMHAANLVNDNLINTLPNDSNECENGIKNDEKAENKSDNSYIDSESVEDTESYTSFSDESENESEEDESINDDNYYKAQMLNNISKEHENNLNIEDEIINCAIQGKRINLVYQDENMKHYFSGNVNGKVIKLNLDEANKLYALGCIELISILKNEIKCNICGNTYKMNESFLLRGDPICLSCSCKEQYIDLQKKLFVDPLVYETEFTTYGGLYVKCRKHKGFSPISRFISLKKENKSKFYKECHFCRLRYKKRTKMINNIKKELIIKGVRKV